jgi:hypothetical protein
MLNIAPGGRHEYPVPDQRELRTSWPEFHLMNGFEMVPIAAMSSHLESPRTSDRLSKANWLIIGYDGIEKVVLPVPFHSENGTGDLGMSTWLSAHKADTSNTIPSEPVRC